MRFFLNISLPIHAAGQGVFLLLLYRPEHNLRTSSPGSSGGLWDEKRKESLQLRLWNLNIRIEKCWLAEMTLVMKSLPLFTLARVFLMFDIYIPACFCFTLIDGTLTAQSTESHLGIGGGIQTTWGRKGVKTWENRKQERPGGERGKSGRWEFLKVESGRNRENLFNKA